MSAIHLIQRIFEIVMIVTMIVGFIYEPSIVEWEQKVFKKLKGGKNHETNYF